MWLNVIVRVCVRMCVQLLSRSHRDERWERAQEGATKESTPKDTAERREEVKPPGGGAAS